MPNINKNIIMQAGAAVANATHKAAGLSASTPEPGTIISAIQLVNGGRKIGPAALAHFTESVRNKLLSLLVNMEPIQDLHGYSHPWPAGGGKNKWNPTTGGNAEGTYNGITYTKNNDGSYSFSGTATGSTWINFGNVTLPSGTWTASVTQTGSYTGSVSFGANNGAFHLYPKLTNYPRTVTSGSETTGNFSVNFANGTSITGTLTLWIQIESGSSASPWEPYENICPITGRTGLDVYAGPTSAIGDATTYSMDWTTPAGAVYAGSADIVTGDIKAAPYYASYNGETLVGPWISSMDAYDPEGTPTTGAQVVDLGGTMTEYHITGQDIVTLVGDNYIWSDSGDVIITE